MARKRAPWMPETPTKPEKRPTVFAVLPWRGDGRYKLDQAIRVSKRRKAADDFAEKDTTGTLCVRELDAPTKPCPGCDAPSDPATWTPLTYEGRTRDACPACHSDQAQLNTEEGT